MMGLFPSYPGGSQDRRTEVGWMLLTTGVLGASGVSEKTKKISQWGAEKKSKGGFERRKSIRGVLFAFFGSGFAHIFRQIVSIRVKILKASFANALSEGKNLLTKVLASMV